MKFFGVIVIFILCVVSLRGQLDQDESFDLSQFNDLKFFITHRGGLIVPGKIIRGGDASCVTTILEENREEGNYTFIVEFTEQGRPARVTHPAYPLEDGFAFEALSGGLVYVKVVDTDYSNYAIVLYTYKERSYPIVMATNRMANSIIRQRFMEITGGTLVALEVIDNRACQRN